MNAAVLANSENKLNDLITALALARAKLELALFEHNRSNDDIIVRFRKRLERVEAEEKEAKAAHEMAMMEWISVGAFGESPPYLFDEAKLRDARVAIATQEKLIKSQLAMVETARKAMMDAEKAVRREAERANQEWEERKLTQFRRIVEEELIPIARVLPAAHALDQPMNVLAEHTSTASSRVLDALRNHDSGIDTPLHLLRSGGNQYSATPADREARIKALCEGKSI